MREFPASPMQAAVHAAFLNSLTHSTANTQVSINFGEFIEVPLIHKAWKWLVHHHGLLRSSFKRPSGGTLTLREHEDCEIAWRSLDWTKVPQEEIAPKWQQLQLEDASESIDLAKPPLYRFHVIELPGGLHHLLWTFHSILLDEKSVFFVLRDWLRLYSLLRGGQQPPSSSGAFSYAAAIGAIEGADRETANHHWKSMFQGFSNWRPLQSLYAGRKASSHALTACHTEFFDRERTALLNQLANSAGVSLLTLLQAAWGLVLARTHTEADTIFGVYRSCRPLLESQAADTVGLFDSLLPLRVKLPEDLTCKEWLCQLAQEEAASAHFLLTNPAEIWPNGRNGFPRFDSTLHYFPGYINDLISMEMPEWTRFDVRLQKASFVPIRILAYGGERFSLALEYNTYQVSPSLARQLFDRLVGVIRSFEGNLDQRLSDVPTTLPHEAENLISIGSSSSERGSFRPLFSSFGEIVQQIGDRPAVEKEGESLSFSSIEEDSKRIAAFLKTRAQQQTGSIVALAVPLSPNMLIGLLGILRAGCVCLALEPGGAAQELEKIVEHYKVALVLTDDKCSEHLGKIQQPVMIIDRVLEEMTSCPENLLPLSVDPSEPAIFLLRPDGERTLVLHGVLQLALENAIHTYQTKPGDRILCHSLAGSAASFEEYMVAFFTGATLVIPGKNVKSTRTAFQETIESRRITHLRVTAAFWSQWVHYLKELGHRTPPSLRRVLIEAGHISYPIIEAWSELIQNETDCVVFYSPSSLIGLGTVTDGIRAPEIVNGEMAGGGLICGRPQPGTVAAIADNRHRLIPAPFPGNLFLGRTQAASNEKNHSAGLVSFGTNSGTWQFAPTGEQARWNENGQLVLSSEPYTQLPEGLTWMKLRLIKEALVSHPEVIDAVVDKYPSKDGQLSAWFVPRDSHAQFPITLEAHLRERLPKNWIPSLFALVTRFALNAFDQIDAASLPQPKPKTIPATTTAPVSSNTLQSSLLSIATLRGGTGDTSLYFIHAGRGLVEDYRPVVQALPGGYGVHCLVVPRGRLASPATIEEIVQQLVPVLRLHATGKFAIAGIGTGAIFAWELARQLDQRHEKGVPFILFEIPPVGGKEPANWLLKVRNTLFGNEPAPYAPSGRFAELVAAYQPPVLPRKPYFFISGKPDPEWRRRAPLGVWGQLHGSALLEQPEEMAHLLQSILASLEKKGALFSEK
ncbi:MAG: hypothetical protein C5B47_01960 [Verrucomicrobia bacterium]|nr:MAG: hypothetical protein C5B47_01960 [Verrucomicrobiota bacterium]